MKVSISGTTSKRSPMLKSSQFAIAPNASYTLSCQVKTTGLSKGLEVYLVEGDAAGNWSQRGSTAIGDDGMDDVVVDVHVGPTAAKAYFKARITAGTGRRGWTT